MQYDNVHRGYDTSYVKQDPHRLLPVDVARELEQQGSIGKRHETVYSTTGVATTPAQSARMRREIAAQWRAAGVDAVILTSTWGTSTRCGAAIAKELERSGLPTVQASTMTPVAVMVGANRIVAQALQALQTEVVQLTVFGGDPGTTTKSEEE